MRNRTLLDRQKLEERFDFDTENGVIRYRISIKGIKAGDAAGVRRADGYVRVKIEGRAYFAHRLIYFMATGKQPEYLDHINGDKSDNRIENLREATNSQNMCNHQKRQPVGVFLRGRKWHGRVMKDYKTYRIQPSESRETAEMLLSELRDNLHGEFAKTC